MPDSLRVLGQASPAAATLTALYTVPDVAGLSAAVSSLVVCNRNTTQVSFRVSVAIAGAADTAAQYLYYDLPLLGNDTFTATIGITLGPTDVVRVRASSGNVAFNLFGSQVS